MFKVVIAHSEDIDTEDVIEDLLDQVREDLGDDQPKAGLLFACVDHDYQQLVDGVMEAFPAIELVGCTTDAEISTVLGFAEDSVALTLFVSDEVEFAAGVGRDVSKDPVGSLATAAEEARGKLTKEPALALFTPTGLTASGSTMVEALRSALGEEVVLFGGTAGDQWKFEKTHQFYGNEVMLDGAPFLLLSTPIKFSSGARSGWQPIANKGTVTKVENNVVHEIDNGTAIQFYRHYLGDGTMDNVGEFPLAVFEEDGETFFLRAALFGNDEDGTVTFAGDVEMGATVQLTHASRDAVIGATREAVDLAIKEYPGDTPTAAM
ncbi:MAG: hypothetical protein HOC05_11210, partial [Gemmatimonadetes bacterium]|nr:hypothetical protein [Gemmatimonadota bacterium]